MSATRAPSVVALTAQLGVPCDRLGRLPVDDYLRVEGVPGVFAAGDVAAAIGPDYQWDGFTAFWYNQPWLFRGFTTK